MSYSAKAGIGATCKTQRTQNSQCSVGPLGLIASDSCLCKHLSQISENAASSIGASHDTNRAQRTALHAASRIEKIRKTGCVSARHGRHGPRRIAKGHSKRAHLSPLEARGRSSDSNLL